MKKKILTIIDELKPNAIGLFDVEYTNDSLALFVASFDTREQAKCFIITEGKLPKRLNYPAHEMPARNDFSVILSSIEKVLTEKNKRYGNSALNPLSVFNGKSKVGQRADDKLSRIQNSEALRKNDVCDLIGYLVLMCKENNWTDFTDQID